MIGFVLNPPGSHGRRRLHRKSRARVRRARKTSKAAMAWKRSVKKFGVKGAALRRARRRAASKKARRTIRRKARMARNPVRKVRRVRRAHKARKAVVHMARKAHRKVRRRRHMKRNAFKGHKSAHRRAALKGWRRRRRSHARRNPVEMAANPRRHRSHRRHYRRNPFTSRTGRRAARRAWRTKPGRRAMVRRARRNVRKALNKRFGVRRWVKHSRAKWNPGTSLSVSGVTKSVTSVFNLDNLYDGLAVAGGIVGALALPRAIEKLLPVSLTSKLPLGMSLSTGWFSYVASLASAGLLGYVSGWALGRRYGEKVFYGGLGATIAKIVLDLIPGVKGVTGVGLSAYNPSLQRAIEAQVARELGAGNMSAYVSPKDIAGAQALGEYLTPDQALTAGTLGEMAEEFSEGSDFDA